jgi:hypothetical protein
VILREFEDVLFFLLRFFSSVIDERLLMFDIGKLWEMSSDVACPSYLWSFVRYRCLTISIIESSLVNFESLAVYNEVFVLFLVRERK